jgi:hypothetical protein
LTSIPTISSNSLKKKKYNVSIQFGLNQVIHELTHLAENSLIDLFYGGCFSMLLCVALALATTQKSANWRVVALSSCRGMPNGALPCGVLSRCHIVARFKLKDWLIINHHTFLRLID